MFANAGISARARAGDDASVSPPPSHGARGGGVSGAGVTRGGVTDALANTGLNGEIDDFIWRRGVGPLP